MEDAEKVLLARESAQQGRAPLAPDSGHTDALQCANVSHGPHADTEFHHHHSHAACSHHAGHHHLLSVEDLTVAFDMYDPEAPYFRAVRVRQEVLHNLTLSVHEGEILAVVGASGSGKTVLADALLGLYESNAQVSGRIWFDGEAQSAESLARLRGVQIALVPQSVDHLDPLMRVGAQVQGVPRGRTRAERAVDAQVRTVRQQELFAAYGLAPEVALLYPHELSGGMARRVLLMCALMERPRLIIADEPTPGLDMERAVHALDDLRAFADTGGGVLLITHDLELALRVADRVAVFKDGQVVEETSTASFVAPGLLRHPFSRALCTAMRELHEGDANAEGSDGAVNGAGSRAANSGDGCDANCTVRFGAEADVAARAESDATGSAHADDARSASGGVPLLCVRNLSFSYKGAEPLYQDFSLDIEAGERVALVAPSGAGKTTLCRLMAGYLAPDAGEVLVDGTPVAAMRSFAAMPRPVQLIAQHPEHAFDPRLRMRRSLAEAGSLEDDRACELRRCFGIRDEWLERLPHELSGGELMRFCLVRALTVRPRVLICDESTAMLDLVTQAELWRVICKLQTCEGFALVFVSHNLALVRRLATRIVEL